MRQFIPQDKPCAVGASEPTARSGFSCLDFHKNKWDHLCKYYNWRPYLGWDEQAKIIHFHGPKVENIKKLINGKENVTPILKFLYNKNPDAYKKYYNLAVSFE
jgi:hypothetical protein